MKMWIARDKDGSLYLHRFKPYAVWRDVGDYRVWTNEDEDYLLLRRRSFPEVTFENSPMEVELKLIEK